MARFGFCGPAYTSQSVTADCQSCINFYPEADESGNGKSALVLYPAPGLKLFVDLGGNQVRGQITFNGRTFVVVDSTFWEIFANGSSINRGIVAQDLNLVDMAAGPNQILIASAGLMFVFDLTTNVLTALDPVTTVANVSTVAFLDGFFVALIKNSNKIQTSALLDATTWPGLNVNEVSEFPDNVVSMAILHREVVLFGLKASVVYDDLGLSPGSPLGVNQSAGVIEQGAVALYSPVNLDNTVFWLGQDSRGAGIAWRFSGYTPVRISTHAMEFAWSRYPTIADAIGYGYQDQGHSFFVLTFPSGNATWVYDVATQLWHQRAAWNGLNFTRHLAQNHVYCFGKHLVGDFQSGKVYEMSIDFLTDNGQAIRRVRRAPHVSLEQQWMFHSQLEVILETGIGPQPPLLDGQGNPRGPMASLRWSDDGGHTWSNYHDEDMGQTGKYRTRVMFRRLGRSRDRVYELSCADPAIYRVIDAYLEATPNYKPSERISEQLRKVS